MYTNQVIGPTGEEDTITMYPVIGNRLAADITGSMVTGLIKSRFSIATNYKIKRHHEKNSL
jgi:hypothetical protein